MTSTDAGSGDPDESPTEDRAPDSWGDPWEDAASEEEELERLTAERPPHHDRTGPGG